MLLPRSKKLSYLVQGYLTLEKHYPYKALSMPCTVVDEEDQSITASSIVTVTVTLKRQSMETFLNKEGMPDLLLDQPQEEQVQPAPQEEEQDQDDEDADEESKEVGAELYITQ